MTDADNVHENHLDDPAEAATEAATETPSEVTAEVTADAHGEPHGDADGRSPAKADGGSGHHPPLPDNVQHIVDALDDKRAKDIVVLNLHEVSSSLDWFVIATGESSLQLRALETGVREDLRELGMRPRSVEGPSDRWILLDYGGIITHLMSPDARSFYDLEGLWADADRVSVTPS